MSLWQSIILAIVEGLTEYLPISSTGHIIIASSLMGIQDQEFTKDFTVIVQFGAILSVLVAYWQRFKVSWEFYLKLAVAVSPALVIGALVKKHIDVLLGDVRVVAFALIIGGVVLIFTDRLFATKTQKSVDDIGLKAALIIGISQCFAFIPGVSRSAASILGGLACDLDRKTAAEFSFFLAVPTLGAATLYKCLKILPSIQTDQISAIVIGNIVSFFVGLLTIKLFIGYLSTRGFKVFGYYRILAGILILALLAAGHSLQVL